MNAWGKQIGLGIALVLSVALVTLLFSFLGTLTCAALVGMMFGATRRWRWQVILVSLVFPAIITVSMNYTKTNLTTQQNLVLPFACFGVFWLTYLLTCALAFFEKREGTEPKSATKPVPTTAASAGGENAPAASQVPEEPVRDSALAELQGTWSLDTPAVNGEAGKRIFQLARDRLVLSVVDQRGLARVICRGGVELERLGPFRILRVFDSPSDASVGTSKPPATWIYRISGQRLFLASNLDAGADGPESRIETYVKQPSAG